MATVHPASILRAPEEETRHRERAAFVDDLKKIAAAIAERQPSRRHWHRF